MIISVVSMIVAVAALIFCYVVYFKLRNDMYEAKGWVKKMEELSEEDHEHYSNAMKGWASSVDTTHSVMCLAKDNEKQFNEIKERIDTLFDMMENK